MNRYVYTRGTFAGPVYQHTHTGNCFADDMQDAAEIAAGHPYVNLVRPVGATSWHIEERIRQKDGSFVRRLIGTIERAP